MTDTMLQIEAASAALEAARARTAEERRRLIEAEAMIAKLDDALFLDPSEANERARREQPSVIQMRRTQVARAEQAEADAVNSLQVAKAEAVREELAAHREAHTFERYSASRAELAPQVADPIRALLRIAEAAEALEAEYTEAAELEADLIRRAAPAGRESRQVHVPQAGEVRAMIVRTIVLTDAQRAAVRALLDASVSGIDMERSEIGSVAQDELNAQRAKEDALRRRKAEARARIFGRIDTLKRIKEQRRRAVEKHALTGDAMGWDIEACEKYAGVPALVTEYARDWGQVPNDIDATIAEIRRANGIEDNG